MEEFIGRDDAYPSIFMQLKQIRVSTHQVPGTSFQRCHQIFIVIRISVDCPEFQTAFGGFGNQRQSNDPPINLFGGQRVIPLDAGIVQSPSNFIKDGRRADKMKRLIL